MRQTAQPLLVLVLAVLGLFPRPADAGDALAVTLDGRFREWRGVTPAADPAGDGAAAGLDLFRLWLANDAEALYLRLNVGRETILQNPIGETLGNRLRLYLDLDGFPSTGLAVGSLGVELEVRFGERAIFRYDEAGDATAINPGLGEVLALPTHSAAAFEIRVPLPAPLPRRLRLMLREETPGGDRMPDRGVIVYKPDRREVEAAEPLELARPDPRHVRLLSLNVEDSLISRKKALYQRLLRALAPDILNIQSLTAWDAERTRLYVENVLPHPEDGLWWAAEVADCVTVSAYPILDQAAVDRNLLLHIDLPDDLTPHDLVLFNVHLPCCADDAGRDREADNLMRTWRDLLDGSGPFAIDPEDAVVLAGDFNFVGLRRQLEAVRDGVFIDPALGPPFSPGRENGALATAPLRHTHAATTFTWRRAAAPFAPGKLDFIFFSDDVAELGNDFVLDTASMPGAALGRHRLRRNDSLQISDHLALVADFLFRSVDPL